MLQNVTIQLLKASPFSFFWRKNHFNRCFWKGFLCPFSSDIVSFDSVRISRCYKIQTTSCCEISLIQKPSLSPSYNNENNPQMAPQVSLEWKSSPPMDYSGQPGHPLHSDTKYNYLCFSYKLRIRKRGSDRKWWKEQEKRNTGGVLSPTTLSTFEKSNFVNLSLQRQRFRSAQEKNICPPLWNLK